MIRSHFIRPGVVAAVALTFLGMPHTADSQSGAEKAPQFFTKVWESDSLDISFPSLSPDGKWIVFENYAFGRSNLWVVSSSGGTPIALTTGAHVDGFPSWFPSGDKIAFVSDRTNGVMVIGFDRQTGHAVGAPRRVTLDKADRFAISTKGDRIAYMTQTSPSRYAVRVLPASGGTATNMGEVVSVSVPLVPAFSPDDRYVFFTTTTGTDQGNVSVVRVPVSGGPTESVISGLPSNLYAFPLPAHQQVLKTAGGKGALISFSGDTNAIFDLGGNKRLQPSHDGLFAFAVGDRTVAPVRVVRKTGASSNVTAGHGYDVPLAWSADGKRVLYSLGDSTAQSLANVWTRFEESDISGQNKRSVSLRPTNLTLGATARPLGYAFTSDRRYAAFRIDSMNRPNAWSFVVVDLQTGVARTITSHATGKSILTGSGDWYATNHGEFLYSERNGDQLDVRAAKPSGETRLIRSIPANALAVAVEGDDIAYVRLDGDSASLFAAHGATENAKVVARFLGRIDEIVWSPDAKWIAATISGHNPAMKTESELAFIPVNTPGQPRFISTGLGGYGAVWTRDASAVFYLKADKAWRQMSVWRYPLRADAVPENVTKNESGMIWQFVPSPDGSAVLIPPERNRGATLWRVDLQQAVQGYRTAKGRGD